MSQVFRARSPSPLFSWDWHSVFTQTKPKHGEIFILNWPSALLDGVGGPHRVERLHIFIIHDFQESWFQAHQRRGFVPVGSPNTKTRWKTVQTRWTHKLRFFLKFGNSKLSDFLKPTFPFWWGLAMGGELPPAAGKPLQRCKDEKDTAFYREKSKRFSVSDDQKQRVRVCRRSKTLFSRHQNRGKED